MTDNIKTMFCFTNAYRPDHIYLKLSPECLNLLKFLEEKDILNNDWEFENIKEIKIYEF